VINRLLDTHTFLWFVLGAPHLSPLALATILDPANVKNVSRASLWELAIKVSLGKIKLNRSFADFISRGLAMNGFQILEIHTRHLVGIVNLPFHHRDPFDRMLIAQSLEESMPIVSADAAFDAYGVTRLW
jgi:PIN domain nuclease of toxin-antitoxin system